MKKFVFAIMALACFSWNSYGQDVKSLEKKIIGKWVNPYTYESIGELKGFHFKKGGKCKGINIPTLDLKTWKIDEEGYLIVEGFNKTEDGKIEEYKTRERIGQLNADTLQTIVREKNPRLGFLYLNMKVIKKKCTPGKVYYDDEE